MILILFVPSISIGQVQTLATIAPIYGVLAELMKGVDKPELLIKETQSPHQLILTPSMLRKLNQAEMVVRISPELESAIRKPIDQLESGVSVISLVELDTLHLLPLRFEHNHDHGVGGSNGQETEESHDDHDEEEHEEHAHDHEEHDEAQKENAGSTLSDIDPHIWLSGHNIRAITYYLARRLSELDKSNKELYWQNANDMVDRIDALEQKIHERLDQLQQSKFMVFHDSLQYFENEFSLTGGAAITLNPGHDLGAATVSKIRRKIEREDINCVFVEPQFGERPLKKIVNGLNIKTAVIDPIGNRNWFELMDNISLQLRDCLQV